eukprot:1095616-Pyramimonas_sp.AAC.1
MRAHWCPHDAHLRYTSLTTHKQVLRLIETLPLFIETLPSGRFYPRGPNPPAAYWPCPSGSAQTAPSPSKQSAHCQSDPKPRRAPSPPRSRFNQEKINKHYLFIIILGII